MRTGVADWIGLYAANETGNSRTRSVDLGRYLIRDKCCVFGPRRGLACRDRITSVAPLRLRRRQWFGSSLPRQGGTPTCSFHMLHCTSPSSSNKAWLCYLFSETKLHDIGYLFDSKGVHKATG